MRMADALMIAAIGIHHKGYRVHYARVDGRFHESGYFPDYNEPLIPSEVMAWELAGAFARRTFGKYVDIYVVDDKFSPVPGYAEKKIVNR